MKNKKTDLRFNDHKEAIIEMANAVEKCPLTNRALALLISDSCGVTLTQATRVLDALPKLSQRYIKKKEGRQYQIKVVSVARYRYLRLML